MILIIFLGIGKIISTSIYMFIPAIYIFNIHLIQILSVNYSILTSLKQLYESKNSKQHEMK